MEYHAFGIISEGKHSKYHYMICGVQGDFTRSLVNDPPATLWTRELKVRRPTGQWIALLIHLFSQFAGVSNTSTLYKRGVRICTGTGIGAALSTCLQSPYWFLIWIGSDQEKTFGPTISGLIHLHIGPERYEYRFSMAHNMSTHNCGHLDYSCGIASSVGMWIFLCY